MGAGVAAGETSPAGSGRRRGESDVSRSSSRWKLGGKRGGGVVPGEGGCCPRTGRRRGGRGGRARSPFSRCCDATMI